MDFEEASQKHAAAVAEASAEADQAEQASQSRDAARACADEFASRMTRKAGASQHVFEALLQQPRYAHVRPFMSARELAGMLNPQQLDLDKLEDEAAEAEAVALHAAERAAHLDEAAGVSSADLARRVEARTNAAVCVQRKIRSVQSRRRLVAEAKRKAKARLRASLLIVRATVRFRAGDQHQRNYGRENAAVALLVAAFARAMSMALLQHRSAKVLQGCARHQSKMREILRKQRYRRERAAITLLQAVTRRKYQAALYSRRAEHLRAFSWSARRRIAPMIDDGTGGGGGGGSPTTFGTVERVLELTTSKIDDISVLVLARARRIDEYEKALRPGEVYAAGGTGGEHRFEPSAPFNDDG